MHWRAGGEAAEARGVRRPPAVDAGRVPVGRRACVSRAMRTAYSMYPAECHACVCAGSGETPLHCAGATRHWLAGLNAACERVQPPHPRRVAAPAAY